MQAIQVEDDVARQFSLHRAIGAAGAAGVAAADRYHRAARHGDGRRAHADCTNGHGFRAPGRARTDGSGRHPDRRAQETLLPACPGDTFASDLATSSVAGFAGPYDLVRLYLPATTLDRLADDQGLPRVRGVHMMPPQVQDPVTQRLALSLLPVLEAPQAGAAQCLDTVALALHAHITRSDGGTPASRSYTGPALAPWQLRRVRAFVDDNLDGDLSTADLAAACSLSPSHFARAFSGVDGHVASQMADQPTDRASEGIDARRR